jgi:hypothetical protein
VVLREDRIEHAERDDVARRVLELPTIDPERVALGTAERAAKQGAQLGRLLQQLLDPARETVILRAVARDRQHVGTGGQHVRETDQQRDQECDGESGQHRESKPRGAPRLTSLCHAPVSPAQRPVLEILPEPVVSRVLSGRMARGDHFSGSPVAERLKRPTRES